MAKKSSKQKPPGPPTAAEAAEQLKFAWTERRTRIALGLILAFSTALGVIAILQFMKTPFFNHPVIDEQDFVAWAREIAGGEWIGKTVFYLDPLYPYTLAVIFKIFGRNLLIVRLFQVLLGTAGVGLCFGLGKRLMGNGPGLLAAGLMAGYGALYFFELQILKETMTIFFSAAACALAVRAADRPRARAPWVLFGISLGLLTLLRGNFQALLPFLVIGVYFFQRPEPQKPRLLRALLAAIGVALVIVPVTIRNYAVAGQFVATRLGGANFYIGNSEYADGRYAKLPFVRPHPKFEDEDFEKEAERRLGHPLTPAEASHYWVMQGVKWILQNPGAAARLWGHKARLMVHQYEIPDNHNFYIFRGLFVRVLYVPFLGFGWLWGPALIGLLVLVRKDPRSLLPGLFGLLYPLSIIPFYILDRYRLAVVPVLCVFAAGGIFWGIEKWRKREWRTLGPALAAIAVTFAVSFLPLADASEPLTLDYYQLGNVYCSTGQPAEGIRWYDRALADLSDSEPELLAETQKRRTMAQEIIALRSKVPAASSADDLNQIGRRLEELGQPALAAGVYEKAVIAEPRSFVALARLGELLCTYDEILEPSKGRTYLNRALDLSPNDLGLLNNLAYCYYFAGDKKTARQWWEMILRRDPDFEPARQALENPVLRGQVR